MTDEMTLYGIHLEDYSASRAEGKTSLYCERRFSLKYFADKLSKNDWAKERYESLILAIKDPQNHPSYSLFEKEFPSITRYKMILAQANVLEDCTWNFVTQDESIYSLHASEMLVDRMLVKDDHNLYRFIWALIVDLKVNLQGRGWVSIKDDIQGFPCIYSHRDNKHEMDLYICDRIYTLDQIEEAIKDTIEYKDIDLEAISRDIVGEGWL